MSWSMILRGARRRSGLSLRELARQAATSHSTLAAYEAGRVAPGVETFDRILRSAGVELVTDVRPRMGSVVGGGAGGPTIDRGDELREVLELAEVFPSSPHSTLMAPVFPRVPVFPSAGVH